MPIAVDSRLHTASGVFAAEMGFTHLIQACNYKECSVEVFFQSLVQALLGFLEIIPILGWLVCAIEILSVVLADATSPEIAGPAHTGPTTLRRYSEKVWNDLKTGLGRLTTLSGEHVNEFSKNYRHKQSYGVEIVRPLPHVFSSGHETETFLPAETLRKEAPWRTLQTILSSYGHHFTLESLMASFPDMKDPIAHAKTVCDSLGIKTDKWHGTFKGRWGRDNKWSELQRSLSDHFKDHGTPVMLVCDGFVYTVLGVGTFVSEEQWGDDDSYSNRVLVTRHHLWIHDPQKGTNAFNKPILYRFEVDQQGLINKKNDELVREQENPDALVRSVAALNNEKHWELLVPQRS